MDSTMQSETRRELKLYTGVQSPLKTATCESLNDPNFVVSPIVSSNREVPSKTKIHFHSQELALNSMQVKE